MILRPLPFRLLLIAISTLSLLPAAPRAQTTTADGVDAFLRGDYAAAAAILRPLTENPWQEDHAAEFFMAALYEGGLGVPADPVRACALYVRAGSERTPLSGAAGQVILMRRRTLDRDAFDTCTWHANFGFDHHFDPMTIALDQGHWIAWDLKGATVTHRGAEKRRDLPLASRGAVFLPLRYTALATGDTRSDRRHFIELFKWEPLRQPRTWRLFWILFEVAREELISVASESVLTASGDAPPATSDQSFEAKVRLGVNDRGEAEWTILNDPARRSAVIESDARRQERRAAEQQVRDRQAAAARVDYKRVRDRRRAPELIYPDGNGGGCAHVFLYGLTNDRSEAISVRIDRQLLQGSMTASYDLAGQRAGLEVLVHVYERAIGESMFCTDARDPQPPAEDTWRAVAGTLSILLYPPGIPGHPPFMYRATVRLSGAQFISPSGQRVDQTQPIALTAIVGWLAG